MTEVVRFNPRVLKVPYLICLSVIALSIYHENYWLLSSIPLIYVGWVCAAPNLNLADGCLPQIVLLLSLLAMLIWVVNTYFWGIVCWLSWLLCSLELAWRCETGHADVKPSE